MIKKLFYLFALGAIGYMLFMPTAAQNKQSEFESLGSSDASVFELFKAD